MNTNRIKPQTEAVYNTQMPRLTFPEYGRNIQRMVDYCLTIEDREERNRCARTIVDTMGKFSPHLRDTNDFVHILWDHLAIMSDFKLDIDYPYEVVKIETLRQHPTVIPYPQQRIKLKHYGLLIEKLIAACNKEEDENKKAQLSALIANQMKKNNYTYNNNKGVDDAKVLDDLHFLSGGGIDLQPTDVALVSEEEIEKMLKPVAATPAAGTGKKKKKK